MGFVLTGDRGLGAVILMADSALIERKQKEIRPQIITAGHQRRGHILPDP